VVVLFDLVTDLLVTLPAHQSFPAESGRHSAFFDRHGLSGGMQAISKDGLGPLRDSLRRGVITDAAGASSLLSDHLTDRLLELRRAFCGVAGHFSQRFTPAQTVRLIQQWDQTGHMPEDPTDKRFVRFRAKYSLRDALKWRGQVRALRKIGNRRDAFAAFADLEQAIETLELPTGELDDAILTDMELRADILRGK
jgi:hypothetical protein